MQGQGEYAGERSQAHRRHEHQGEDQLGDAAECVQRETGEFEYNAVRCDVQSGQKAERHGDEKC